MNRKPGLYTLNVSKVGHLSVPVIPLAEQHRIVAEIDTQFTRLDAVVIALKRVQTNLKRYRASVLKAACTGHLVPTEAELTRAEGRSYESADQLLQRILQSRRAEWEAEQLAAMQAAGKAPKDDKWKSKYRESVKPDTSELPELPEGWVWSSLGAIAGVQLGKMLSPKAYEDGLLQLPYLRNENIRWGWINFDDIKKMGFKKHELERYSIEPYDLIVCEGGEAGRCAVYTGVAGQFMYQKALHRVRPVGHLVIPYFIQFCIQHYVHSGTVIPNRQKRQFNIFLWKRCRFYQFLYLRSTNNTASLLRLNVVSPSLTNSKPPSLRTSNGLIDFARRYSNGLSRGILFLRTQPTNRQVCCLHASELSMSKQGRSQRRRHSRPTLINPQYNRKLPLQSKGS